jgi:hypothetical protein
MVAERSIITEVQGVIEASNDRGIRLAGETSWRNVSKFASVTIPAAGAIVVLGLDKAGYIREITASSGAPSGNLSASSTGLAQPAPAAACVDRETRITRSACLNTAVSILSTKGSVDVSEVFDVAERLEP